MANNNDWLPKREQDLADLCQKWKTGLENPANVTAFGWNKTEVQAALTQVNAFLTSRAAYKENDSTRNHLIKEEAKEAAKNAMRDFANSSIRYNKLMKEEDKREYGVHTAAKAHPAGEPKSFPEAEADSSVIRQLTIKYWDSATKKRAKPHGVSGAEIRWGVLDREPSAGEELPNSDLDTASPYTLRFDESERGKRVYYCLRWDSTTKLKGPFGEIYSAVIP